MVARGEFEVELTPLPAHGNGSDGNTLARMSIDKTFRGDLVATSSGEMLSLRTAVETSAGYVALEQIQGTLAGRRGSFALQHFGVMTASDSELILRIVPDSAGGELAGLAGHMTIGGDGDRHTYVLEYQLP